MNTNQIIKQALEEFENKFVEDNGVEWKGFDPEESPDLDEVRDFISQAITQAVENNLKALKLKARSIGSPDGYVNIEKLFDNKHDYKDIKEMLDKLTK